MSGSFSSKTSFPSPSNSLATVESFLDLFGNGVQKRPRGSNLESPNTSWFALESFIKSLLPHTSAIRREIGASVWPDTLTKDDMIKTTAVAGPKKPFTTAGESGLSVIGCSNKENSLFRASTSGEQKEESQKKKATMRTHHRFGTCLPFAAKALCSPR